MKKLLAVVLTCTLLGSLLTGCAGTTVVINECDCPTDGNTANVTETTETVMTETENVEAVQEGELKTGLAVVTSVADSVSATEEAAGAVEYDVTVAAVTVDEKGIIRSCSIDGIPATVEIDTTGTITSDIEAAVVTKNELGADYGMVAWGGAIAEWDEQVEALCDYAVGKTVEELKEGAIDETGKAPEGSDLASSATIYLGGYVNAIEKAVNNAQNLGAAVGDEMHLVTINALDSSTSATEEAEGNVQLDVNMAVLTVKDGVITSALIDGLQAKVAVDATGTITSDLTAEILTKNELGADYGMVAWGGAIAEWNEQAAAFASYITGKTADEVAGIAISETTAPADGTDLASSVTISIGGFQALVAKAFN